jgi:hypothetical protein
LKDVGIHREIKLPVNRKTSLSSFREVTNIHRNGTSITKAPIRIIVCKKRLKSFLESRTPIR